MPVLALILLGLLLTIVPSSLSSSSSISLSSTTILFNVDPATQLAMQDLTSAYLLVSSNTTWQMTKTPAAAALLTAVTTLTSDFVLWSNGLAASQASAYPSLTMFPTMCQALVPIYRLDGLGVDAPQLVLGRDVVARIYLGSITWWNDSAIQATNLGVTMPQQRITMVLPPPGYASTTVWTTALSKFYALFNSTIGVSASPHWPSYYRSTVGSGATGQSSQVISNDGSIGFAYQSIAQQMANNAAALINRAGNTVQATPSSVTFAAVELGTATRSLLTQQMDLTDGTGSSVWPITIMSYLLIDQVNSRATCHVRAAVVEFWLWFYTSSIASNLLLNRQYAPVPSIVLTQLSVVNQLSSNIKCRGSVAMPAVATTTRLIGAPATVSFLSSLFANLYAQQDSSVTWQVQTDTDELILQQVAADELDIAFVNPSNVDPDLLQTIEDDPTFLLLPTYLIAPALLYNPQITNTVNIAAYTLTLDMRTVGLIQYSCVIHWNDPIILSQNPWLAPLLPDVTVQPVLMTIVMGCGQTVSAAPLSFALRASINAYQSSTPDVQLGQCIANYTSQLSYQFQNCISLPSLGLLFTPTESTVPALISGLQGAIGAAQASGDTSYGVVQNSAFRHGVWSNTTASISGMAACASDTFDASQIVEGLALGLGGASANPNCYRPTQQVVAILRANYTASVSASDSLSCSRGYDALQFMTWLITTPAANSLINSVNTVRVTTLFPAILSASLDTLNAVTCDGQTLLVTLPTEWKLSSGVYDFVMTISSLGLIACMALFFLIIRYHAHPVIRSASPLFLVLSIAGLMLLYTAGYLLVAGVTTTTCTTFSWLVNVGLMLTFAPLFAKTWRIYRIFGRKKLSVVAISNKKLLLMVSAFLLVELILMAVWQGVGNLQPEAVDVQTSDHIDSSVAAIASRYLVNEYVQCGVPSGAGKSMFVVVCVEKGLLFVWGALTAFSTRKVTSTFNEAAGITLAIYNTCFTIGIITPIILVINATGDVLQLLLAFALLWIASFTAAVLFGPKVMTIMVKQDTAMGQNNTSICVVLVRL